MPRLIIKMVRAHLFLIFFGFEENTDIKNPSNSLAQNIETAKTVMPINPSAIVSPASCAFAIEEKMKIVQIVQIQYNKRQNNPKPKSRTRLNVIIGAIMINPLKTPWLKWFDNSAHDDWFFPAFMFTLRLVPFSIHRLLNSFLFLLEDGV